ncbi:transglutaminase family protein [Oscillatoria sp. FACHB-1407]|uniref:transglutaminase family protein n=1 Tax=Oscillatoria sp. FACHB-1407 TaxID=2692847 RepID=UPI0016822A08|nr:transglutaminase family protein [Oscillatoria sp. FACHB-1407]MBD2464107.1 transglutaminase family protein [Oscillatoria sp. FACHB-1407]
MRYSIVHTTTYTYDRPVSLLPHVVRLRPRCDVTQSLRHFSVEVKPDPLQITENVDLDGNSILKIWFAPELETDHLAIALTSDVETHRDNPFIYLLEPWATQLPFDYPTSLAQQLQPYLTGQLALGQAIDPIALQLAQEIHHQTGGNVISFLSELNQRIYQTCEYTIRETGEPLSPGITWSQKVGSCRDVTVLFMEVCRAIGLAARFVSGYQEGDSDTTEFHLHAWAEVYLPGAGWRGYDPTHGLAVSDRHIALAASAIPSYAAPVTGAVRGSVRSELSYHLTLKRLD